MTISPFDYVKSICEDKKDAITDSILPESDYNAFMVNRALSFHQDTVLLVQELNKRSTMPKASQYRFLFNTVTKRKRWSKWYKKSNQEQEILEFFMRKYRTSEEKAREIVKVLGKEKVKIIMDASFKGGRKGK